MYHKNGFFLYSKHRKNFRLKIFEIYIKKLKNGKLCVLIFDEFYEWYSETLSTNG